MKQDSYKQAIVTNYVVLLCGIVITAALLYLDPGVIQAVILLGMWALIYAIYDGSAYEGRRLSTLADKCNQLMLSSCDYDPVELVKNSTKSPTYVRSHDGAAKGLIDAVLTGPELKEDFQKIRVALMLARPLAVGIMFGFDSGHWNYIGFEFKYHRITLWVSKE